MGSINSQHVALLAFPFGTHAAPLFTLARALSVASPTGTAFSFLTSAKSAASFSESVTDNLKIFQVSEAAAAAKNEHDPEVEVGRFMKETPGNFKKAMEDAVKGRDGMRITCVISDAFIWFAGEIAAELGAPWVALWTGGPCSLSAHLYTDTLREKFGIDDKGEIAAELGAPWVALWTGGPCSLSAHLYTDTLREKFRIDDKVVASADEDLGFLPGLSGLRVCDLPEGIISGNISGEFAKLLHRMASELPRASAIALNSFQGLNTQVDSDFASKFIKSLSVGPINLLINPIQKIQPDQFNCIQWLDRQEQASVAYISFGTIMCLAPPELVELAEGLEASGVPFIWSLKDFAREHLPAGFLDRTKERGLVVSWAPQVEVLEHAAVGAFITHCGWNSVLESITCGVPMVCRPFLGDQMMNARTVSHVWKVGVEFEDCGSMRRGDVARLLEKVVKEEEGKAMRERMGELSEKAVQAIQQPDGSSVHNFKALLDIVIAH